MTDIIAALEQHLQMAARRIQPTVGLSRRGVVRQVGDGVACVAGLEDVCYEELLAFDSGARGLAFDLRPNELGVVLLSGSQQVHEGEGVSGTGSLPELAVGASTLGRVFDPLGNPLDEGPPLRTSQRLPLFRPTPQIIQRQSVHQPLWTGVMAVDAAIPIGRGQRELIIGDRNTGKSALAIDFVTSQCAGDVVCVVVMIGQPLSRVRSLRDTLDKAGCLSNTAIIAAHASDSPGLQYLAPFAGASVAESFRDAGRHAMIVYDDLTKHADAYRELALLLGRPPGREAYPGDIFYLHAELLERAAALSESLGGGSVTAFPIVETTDGDISAYIPTNLISITDGQIYLDTARFERDFRPAIDIGRSVSRIGAIAQPAPMRQASKNLKIQLSRFEALERLSRVGLDVDPATQVMLRQGALLRNLLRQTRFSPRSIAHQVLTLTAVGEGWLADVAPHQVEAAVLALLAQTQQRFPDWIEVLDRGEKLPADWKSQVAASFVEGSHVCQSVKEQL